MKGYLKQSPSWEKGLTIAHSMPRCGAKNKTRGGIPCKAVAMKNSKCRMHGGVSLSGKNHGMFRTGLYMKETQQLKKCFHQQLKATREIIEELADL
jgi:hypothetical protein